jgi:class 3 adenylate cyclase
MGLHAGDVIRKGHEVIGREVHVAARVASCAAGGEILASAAVRDAVQGTDRFSFEDERTVELKGFTDPYTLWRVSWAPEREAVSS